MARALADGTEDVLRRGDEVVAATAMPGIPEGTRGKVVLAEGFTWIRYWVRFDNGVVRGSIHRKRLARPKDWDQILERRARGEDEPSPAETAEPEAGGESTEDETEAAAGPGSGPASRIPAHLLERSRQAREKANA